MFDGVVSNDACASFVVGCCIEVTRLLDVRVAGLVFVFDHGDMFSGSGLNGTIIVIAVRVEILFVCATGVD